MLKILVLGSSGMLGNTLTRYFSELKGYEVIGTIRSKSKPKKPLKLDKIRIISDVDCKKHEKVSQVFELVRPNVVINCIGIIKQLADEKDPLEMALLNSVLPHRLSYLSKMIDARLIHISTDCVFSGQKGLYKEIDNSDATDLYGRSKFLGEVDYPNSLTLRTSIIGHEVFSSNSLINWFLSQNGEIKGYKKSIFSGLTALEMSKTIERYVLPFPELRGLYHVSVDPVSKYDLLNLVKKIYKKNIEIIPDETVMIDRSLNSDLFRKVTGFSPKSWHEMITNMYESR